ncbi:hypothetical protein DPEC_G00033250 [Dallia pectoralis]|uniref:Uncharacterized protein n=1 Tax=Dallia pectoralis TaxID=75939 RepID=A0ACC2HCW2_DALPE|nr:hypothetical protein DPEC_G00033250 [Dallia pectoralis]
MNREKDGEIERCGQTYRWIGGQTHGHRDTWGTAQRLPQLSPWEPGIVITCRLPADTLTPNCVDVPPPTHRATKPRFQIHLQFGAVGDPQRDYWV